MRNSLRRLQLCSPIRFNWETFPVFPVPSTLGRLASQRSHRDRCGDGRITEESLVVVGRKSNNILDGVSPGRHVRHQPQSLESSMRSLSHRSAHSAGAVFSVWSGRNGRSASAAPPHRLVAISWWSLLQHSDIVGTAARSGPSDPPLLMCVTPFAANASMRWNSARNFP